MTRVIAIVNQKGGVGKTTTMVNLADGLAQLGQRVLGIDMDSQGNATSGFGVNPHLMEKTVYDVLVSGVPLRDVLVTTSVEGVHLAPANVSLAGANVELVSAEEREFQLRKALPEIFSHYDFVLIDCPPSLGLLTINGLVAADEVLIPVQTEYYALEGLGQLLNTIQLVQQHIQPSLQILGAVLTMYDKRNKLSDAVFRDLYEHFPYRAFRSVIPRNVRLAEAPSHGKTIFQYDAHSKGARAYAKLAKEILLTPLPVSSS